MTIRRRLLLVSMTACLAGMAACSGRPAGYAAFEPLPGALDDAGRFDGVYEGEGEVRRCLTPGGETRTYDPPVIAGVVRRGRFDGNLDGCRVTLDVYADGSLRGWTFIRTHRLVPITYSLFEGRAIDGSIAGRFEQVVQGSALRCDRGPVLLGRRDLDPGETAAEAVDLYSPAARCRTGGIQFP